MEWLIWIIVIPVLCLRLLWGASKFHFPEKSSSSGSGSSGLFDAFNDLYNPGSTAARTALEEQKRQIVSSAQGQDRDPLAGFLHSHDADQEPNKAQPKPAAGPTETDSSRSDSEENE